MAGRPGLPWGRGRTGPPRSTVGEPGREGTAPPWAEPRSLKGEGSVYILLRLSPVRHGGPQSATGLHVRGRRAGDRDLCKPTNTPRSNRVTELYTGLSHMDRKD